ncbi:MAG: DUF5320 domain-containing protein [Prolixibacteraceae bacterium]|nr:DUF5320 domain-containing protein [Prolixibacteraceae bacterium]
MPGLNQTGPMGQGPMTGRRAGRCNPSVKENNNDEIKNAVAGLVAVVIIGLTERVWNWIKEKRLKSASK